MATAARRDDTVEVAEHHDGRGRDPFPLLLRRCQLPKTPNVPPVGAWAGARGGRKKGAAGGGGGQWGEGGARAGTSVRCLDSHTAHAHTRAHTHVELWPSRSVKASKHKHAHARTHADARAGGRPMSPRTKRALNIQYYEWRDMHIGAVVHVYGRPLVIYDMVRARARFVRLWPAIHSELDVVHACVRARAVAGPLQTGLERARPRACIRTHARTRPPHRTPSRAPG